jgi:hypothetical protein
VIQCDTYVLAAPRADVESGPAPDTSGLDDYFARYTKELDTEDAALVLRVLKYLGTDLRTGQVLSFERREAMLSRLAKEPVLKVARAAVEFTDGGFIEKGKRFDYFKGILRGSATTWWAEYLAERDKDKFKLEGEEKRRKERVDSKP